MPAPPANLFFQGVHERNINSVKLLINTVLPVRYNEDYFKGLAKAGGDLAKMGALCVLCVVLLQLL